MDYQKFYNEVVQWIYQCNEIAVKHGLASEEFWNWVTDSSAEVCKKYNNNPLVIKQMIMLSDLLADIHENKN